MSARHLLFAAALLLSAPRVAQAFEPPPGGQSGKPALHERAASAADAPLRIGKITVDTLDVYSAAEAEHGAFYRLTDRLHIETRPSLIRSFLLFKEGDPYDADRLAETERNLRALPFLKAASVTAAPPHDGVVDVHVVTQDSWSLEPASDVGSKGGVTTYGLSMTETNIGGWGREMSVNWSKGVDRTRAAIEYRDPAFPRAYWKTRVTWAQNSDGFERSLSIGRPFYSFSTPQAFTLSFTNLEQHETLYRRSRTSSVFGQQHKEVVAAYGLALSPNDAEANRVTYGFHYLIDTFGTLADGRTREPLPDQREYHYLFTRFEHVDNDFVKLDYVNRDSRFEDFNLGEQFTIEGGFSPKVLGSPANSQYAAISDARGFRLGEESFIVPRAGVETRFDHGVQNAIVSAGANYVHRYGSDLPQALVGRFIVNGGWRVDRDLQFFADGGNGLRGYRLHAFEGSRNILFNVEQRIYLGHELLQLVSPGVVAFFDAGNATYGGFSELMHLKADAGIGIRLGLPRTPKNLFRLDVAYPLVRDPRGRRALVVSFSSGQAF